MTSRLKRTLLTVVSAIIFHSASHSQNVLDPTDPVITYDTANPPVQPSWGQIGKWVRTPRVNWNTSDFKCYIYKGIPFRLLYPASYQPASNDNKKYPMLIFWHGVGERDTITDNEYHLLHGGAFFNNSVKNGTFDGYVIMMQNSSGYFNGGNYAAMKELVDYMVANNKVDPFRVVTNGLSAGGASAWDMFLTYPTYIASGIPMSSTGSGLASSSVIDKIKFTPYWNFHGGLDNNPTPYTALFVRDSFLNKGANYINTLYDDLGHGTWNRVWTEPGFWPFFNKAYSSNPWPLFGRTEFCPGETINVTIGLVDGFDEYEWKKDGILIQGATNHTIQATQLGTYSARVRKGSLWSQWSPMPVVIKIKSTTVSPNIIVSGMHSAVLPALDGSTSVMLEVPEGYSSYDWQKDGQSAIISTTRFLNVTTPGDYKVKVTEPYSCNSDFSPLFKVVDANGNPKPDPAINLIATTLSNSSIRLDWSDNPSPQYNETGFEVYQATISGGPYQLIAITSQDIRSFIHSGLGPNKKFYYRIRAFNNTGAAAPSNEASSTTFADNILPTSPLLRLVDVTSTTVSLSWKKSTDDAGLSNYEIYVNGAKSYITTDTSFIVSNLTTGNTYNFSVRAKDFGGNLSAFSNQLTVTPSFGLNYKYYHGEWNTLPDFNTLTPLLTGKVQNVSMEPRTRDDNFAFLWEGYIRIPVSGTYYFRTSSDDGSKMYLGTAGAVGSPYSFSATAVVNNDGLHGNYPETSSPKYLTAGIYPIAFSFFERWGDEVMEVSWKTPLTGNNFEPIPNIYFSDQPIPGNVPSKPSNLKAVAVSYRQINLTWNDNSNNETGFEIYRSSKPYYDFLPIARTSSNITAFADTTLKQNSTYYYRIKAINQYGESDFDRAGQGVDYSYYQLADIPQLPNNFNSLTPYKTSRQPNFDLGMQDRNDNFQLWFSSTIDIPKAGVYTFYLKSDDGSKLYIDGSNPPNMLIDHDGMHVATEKSASKSLTKGPHTIYIAYMESYGPEELTVSIAAPGLPKQKIQDAWLGTPNASSTTFALPTAPLAPSSLVATGVSTSSIEISWQDRSNNETGFEIYRSANNSNNYILFATVPANSTSLNDNGLFANAIYYYKVRAKGAASLSAFTGQDSAKTKNSNPVISVINNRTARYGSTTVIEISASDADGDAIIFTGMNLPAFASLVDHGNRTATLSLNPSASQQGVFNSIRIIATDAHGGMDFTQFDLTVNDNYDPVISNINNQQVVENGSLNISLSATDQNPSDIISWSVVNLPAGYNLTPGANGSANLSINPGYSSSGMYHVLVTATDGAGGISTAGFDLTVIDAAPAIPVLVSAQFNYGNGVQLNWQDQSNNETGFENWRSTNEAGPYALVGTANTVDATNFTDNTVTGNTKYYYRIKSKNTVDVSEFSNTVAVFTNRTPVVSSIANVLLKNNQTSIINLAATDDVNNVLFLEAEGLPSFATLSDYGNGTGQINIIPKTGSTGVYPVTIIARDEFGATGTASFTISIVDRDMVQVYLNFTDAVNLAGKPWNNLVNASTPGTVYGNLKDDNDNASSISVKMVDAFGWTTITGMRSRNGKEIYPESVVRAGIIEPSSGTRTIEVSGLALSGRKYNFIFFNSYDQGRNLLTDFTINGQTVSLEARYNTSHTVQINGISPDANGKVYITIAKDATAEYAALNAMIIQSYETASVSIVSPANLMVKSTTRTTVNLEWQDRSNNETATGGFVIYRADDLNPSFTQVATVNANVNSFTDINLVANRTYYYTVRARANGNAYSAYSNVATANTLADAVYINFNEHFAAGNPWNNLNSPPQINNVWSNLLNESGQPTSLSLYQTNTWSGLYTNGINTGNNSGIFPDHVMIESYGLFPGETGRMKLTGLNVSMRYNLSFFASANDYNDITVAYTVNGRTSLFNASLNKTNTITIYDVVPDENGEVEITVKAGTLTSQLGLVGAMVIESFTPSNGSNPQPAAKGVDYSDEVKPITPAITTNHIKAYPNPFKQTISLELQTMAGEKVNVGIYDLAGRMVHQQQFNNLPEGQNRVELRPSYQMASGVYILKVSLSKKQYAEVIRIIKQ